MNPLDRADAVLRWALPPGDLGASIVGDLRQEFGDRASSGRGWLRVWYVWNALSLAVRYGAVRLGRHLTTRSPDHDPEEWMKNLLADVRLAFRVLRRTPLLSGIAVLTMALGIGVTTHTFSVVYGTILRGLPVPGADRLVHMDASRRDGSRTTFSVSYPDYMAIRDQQNGLEDVAGFTQGTINLAGDDAPPERFPGGFVTGNLFDLMGVAPALGRTITEADDRPGVPLTVVLSHDAWQTRFAGDPQVIGQTLRANSQPATIIGVMPPAFHFPFEEDLWIPLRFDETLPRAEAQQAVDLVARRREGVELATAQADLASLGERLEAEFAETNADIVFTMIPFEERYMPPEIIAVLWVMLAAVFGVLLIACANVANLLLARATIRTREVAIRTAMGASRWRVVRQLLVESSVLVFMGSALGVVLAYAGVDVFNRAILGIQKPFWIDIRLDGAALAFALAASAIAALAAGLLPALRATDTGTSEVLKDEGRGSSGQRSGRVSSLLVTGELALSCALLVASGLMIQSIVNVRNTESGIATAGIMTGRVGLFEGDHPTEESRLAFFRRLRDQLAAEPGVRAAALTTSLPGAGAGRWRFTVEGAEYATERDIPTTWGSIVTQDYFDAVGASLLRGRVIDASDDARAEEAPVVVVSRSFADREFPQGDAVGRQLTLGGPDSELPVMTIVGIVGDVQIGGGVGGIGNDQLGAEQVFIPFGVLDVRFASLVVRTDGSATALAPTIRRIVSDMDPNLPVYDMRSMEEVQQANSWAFGLFGSLFSVFGGVALFLAAVGLYGVVSFSVRQRQRELGVRMALGAAPRDILLMVLRKGAIQIAVGLAFGLGLGWALAQPMGSILYGVRTSDPLVYGLIALTLASTGLIAILVPARAATLTSPVAAMRVD